MDRSSSSEDSDQVEQPDQSMSFSLFQREIDRDEPLAASAAAAGQHYLLFVSSSVRRRRTTGEQTRTTKTRPEGQQVEV